MADAAGERREAIADAGGIEDRGASQGSARARSSDRGRGASTVADADGERRDSGFGFDLWTWREQSKSAPRGEAVAEPDSIGLAQQSEGRLHADGPSGHDADGCRGPWRSWEVEPSMGRVADGVAYRVERLRLCGGGIVPQQLAAAFLALMARLPK